MSHWTSTNLCERLKISKLDICIDSEKTYIEVWTHQSGQGQRWAVALAHEESPKNDLVEGSIRTTGQESVQLQHKMTRNVLFGNFTK